MSAAHHQVTLTVDMTDPGLVPAAFDLLRMQARACGLSDVGPIGIHLVFEVSGTVDQRQVEELRARLEALWFGEIDSDIVTPLKEVQQ